MKHLLLTASALALSLLSTPGFASWDGRVYRAESGPKAGFNEVPFEALRDAASASPQVVLGEKHLTPSVQAAQARVILESAHASARVVDVAWEFLDYRDHERVAALHSDFLNGRISASQLLEAYFGSKTYESYVPILESARELNADLIPVNLSREEKAPVVKGGLQAADPSVVPQGFELGDDAYLERFKEAMGGHSSPEQLSNYFAAQCLTDDVMALHFTALPKDHHRFLVTGSFHSDFKDGVVKRIKTRSAPEAALTVRFYDASDYTEKELEAALPSLLVDPAYGQVADFVYFTGEPTP